MRKRQYHHPLRVLVAPDKFKESLTAAEAAAAIARGVRRAVPGASVRRMPLADGGDGTAAVLTRAWGGRFRNAVVRGPLARPVQARWGFIPGRPPRAALDMASASGLALMPLHRNPLRTTTHGTGQLIRRALHAGCRTVVIGIGGSATVDGGLGAAQALGARLFVRKNGREVELKRPATGGDLTALARIDLSGVDPRLRRATLRVACDVRNPLYGRRGAARVFGPQKGATGAQVRKLDRGLRNLARVIRRDARADVAHIPGAGAAGGLGAGLAGLFGARLERGIDVVLQATATARHVRWSDLVLTGEGRADVTSTAGKTASGLLRLTRRCRKPLFILAGSLGPGWRGLERAGARVAAIAPEGTPRAKALRRASRDLEALTARVMKSWRQCDGFEFGRHSRASGNPGRTLSHR